MLYYDAHTHRDYSSESGVVGVRNCGVEQRMPYGYCSIGMHPSDIVGVESEWLKCRLMDRVVCDRVLAVGECGLDRRYDNFEAQKRIFEVHIAVARLVGKPLVIHCVRALSEVLALSKGCGVSRVLHAWGKWDNNIARSQDVYLSVGYRNMASLGDIPLSRVLLESDDNSEIGIKEVYARFAEARGIEISELQNIIEINFKKVFLCK